LFEKTSKPLRQHITIVETVGKGLVELIENGRLNSQEMSVLLASYLQPMLAKHIDALVLGCTHYPYLIPHIKQLIGPNITIIDSGEAVAKQTKKVLIQHNLLNTTKKEGKHQIYINKNKTALLALLQTIGNIQISVNELDF
jgi:Glutamate racemase